MPLRPPAAHARPPVDPDTSDPADDRDPFNPHIVARSGVRGVCRIHWCERPCNGCLAAEIDSIRVAHRWTATRKAGAQ